MIELITDVEKISCQQWDVLVAESTTATWFQTREAYMFFASLKDRSAEGQKIASLKDKGQMLEPFVVAVERIHESGTKNQNLLKGVIVGYITREKNPLKQLLTRRAIIIGGPLLAEDITNAEVATLLQALNQESGIKSQDKYVHPIYIESRNFNDYSRWKDTFEACGFTYQPHLNFHIDTSSVEVMCSKIGKSRKRDIKAAEKKGSMLVEHPTLAQVKAYYEILQELYQKKVKTPLFPFVFFERLWEVNPSYFMLIEQDGEVISGTVVVRDSRTIYEWFACGKQSHTYPTYRGMMYAAEHGLKRYDMMGAGKPEEDYGVRDFKSQFGGELVEHGRYLCICNKLLYNIGRIGVKILKRK